MGAYRKPDSSSNQGSGVGRSSSLEGLLQQAWLQSQSRPKVVRPSTVADPSKDVAVQNRRAISQSLAQLMSGSVGSGLVNASGETYFHKTRPEEVVPEFLRRRATPRLESFSEKTDVPGSRYVYPPLRRKVSSATSVGSGVYHQDSHSSSMFSSSDSGLSTDISFHGISSTESTSHDASMDELFDAADSAGVSADLVLETEVLDQYFEEFLSNDQLAMEKCLMQLTTASHAAKKKKMKVDGSVLVTDHSLVGDLEAIVDDDVERWNNSEFLTMEENLQASILTSSAYQNMVGEIASLLTPSEHQPSSTMLDADSEHREPEDGHKSTINGGEIFAPSEERTALMIMEGFTCMMSKHIQDVSVGSSGTVDRRKWITEDHSDRIDASFDDIWKAYFENVSFPTVSNAESNLFHGGAGLNLSDIASGVAVPPCSNMMDLLYRCGYAVSRGDTSSATECLEELRKHSSPYGNSMGRMAHYVREALIAKMSGTGEELYTVITNNHPSAETMLRAYRVYVDNCPFIKLKHFLSTKSILDAFEGADRVHVIQYGALFGTEWPSLLKHLSMRPGGPPHFRLTGIDIPYPGEDPLKKLNGMGRRVEQFAKKYRVPFEFQGFAGNFESFTAKDFNIRKGEVLAVSSNRTHLIHDESVVGASPRELLLRRIRSLNPKVVVLYVDSAACNAPFFMTRFRESVKHYSALYDSLEVSVAPDAPERVVIEREVLGRELLNIIACEGQARIERPEPYRQWQNRMERAGFVLRPLNPIVFSKVQAMMASFHRDFGVGEDDGWLLMGIKNQITSASGVWEPKAAMRFIN